MPIEQSTIDQRRKEALIYGEFGKSLYRQNISDDISRNTWIVDLVNPSKGMVDGSQVVDGSLSSRATGRSSRIAAVIVNNSGEGDFVNIAEAMSYMSQKNLTGTVLVRSGTYNEVANIDIPADVLLVGDGIDRTIIDFGNASFSINIVGTSSTIKENSGIKNLTVQNSGATAAITIDYADWHVLENVRSTSNTGGGISCIRSQNWRHFNCRADNNTTYGWSLAHNSSSGRQMHSFTMSGCLADSNTTDGFYINTNGAATGSNSITRYALINCVANSNGDDGFDVDGSNSADASYVGCFANGNTDNGFAIDSADNAFIGCHSNNNTGIGYANTDSNNRFIGCTADENTSANYTMSTGGQATYIGCRFGVTTSATDPPQDKAIWTDDEATVIGSVQENTMTHRKVWRMFNTSGGALAAGDVVVWKAAADGDEVTTTTTQGDDYVFGMAMEAISNNEFGSILVEGRTASLKVDGTTDIAVGDFLGTFTTAKIAMKAATGDMAFAVALEAYATNDSSGVIDAILITPRKL